MGRHSGQSRSEASATYHIAVGVPLVTSVAFAEGAKARGSPVLGYVRLLPFLLHDSGRSTIIPKQEMQPPITSQSSKELS